MDNSKCTTTVVIPCFNAELNISQTIESLLNQTVIPDEILVVDDGSTDRSAEVARAYGHPIKVISQENQGAAVARHVGAKMAANDIVFFIDAGDTSQRSKIEVLKHALVANPNCICAFGESWNKRKEKRRIAMFTNGPLDNSYTVVEDPFKIILSQSWPIVPAMDIAVRKEQAIKGSAIGAFYRAGNDYAMQLSLSRFGSFVHVASLTAEFDILPGGLTDRFGIDQQMAYSLLAAVEFFHKHPSKHKYRQIFKKRISYYWPEIVYFLWDRKDTTLRNQVIRAAFFNASIIDSIKAFKWLLEKEQHKGRVITNPILRHFAKWLIPHSEK